MKFKALILLIALSWPCPADARETEKACEGVKGCGEDEAGKGLFLDLGVGLGGDYADEYVDRRELFGHERGETSYFCHSLAIGYELLPYLDFLVRYLPLEYAEYVRYGAVDRTFTWSTHAVA